MKRQDAARQLGQMLRLEIIGQLLSIIDNADLRDAVLSAAIRCREIAMDGPPNGAIGGGR